jgi:Serine aminopeptidase, S33
MSVSPPIDEPSAADEHVRHLPTDSVQALVIVIGGIGSLDWCGLALRRMLGNKRPPYSTRIFAWGLGFGRWYADLTNVANRDASARALAESIRLNKADQPECPVFLVAKSGGSGIVVKALELLDEDSVERVVLLAPALSPAYDLTRALRAVRREIVVFWSPLDIIILGAGTRVFGTMDRVRSVGAGLVGFRVPASKSADAGQHREYDKLRQIRWSPRMVTSGNFGGHMGPDSPFFLRKYVVPLLGVEETPGC